MNDFANSSSLENQFLIAMPQMVDSYFAHTVTYLWRHSSEGALGIVINKPLQACVADMFSELAIECSIEASLFREMPVLAGGPVERNKGFIIHDAQKEWESSIAVTDGISVCTSKSILEDIARGEGPDNYVVALGCAGWDAGQLEQEIAANAWLTVPASSELIFSNDFQNKAKQAAAILGVELSQLSPETGHS